MDVIGWPRIVEKRTLSPPTYSIDEFAALTNYHRKHAIRVLGSAPREPYQRPGRHRLYDEAVRQTLIVLWEASDRLCGKRLKALVPLLIDAIERHGHMLLGAVLKDKLLSMSAAS